MKTKRRKHLATVKRRRQQQARALNATRRQRLGYAVPMQIAAQAQGDGGTRQRRFSLVAYTGEPLSQCWWDAPVVVDLAGLDISAQRVPILYDHWRDARSVVGQSEAIRVEGGRVLVDGPLFPVTPAAQEVLALADAGFAWQASIGASVLQKEFIQAGQSVTVNGRNYAGPVYVARQTQLEEVSFVVLGADRNTSALVANQANQARGDAMTFEEWLLSMGFEDAASLSEVQRANLQSMYNAEYPAEGDDSGDDSDPTTPANAAAPVTPAATPAAAAASAVTPPRPPATPAVRTQSLAARRQQLATETARVNEITRLCAAAGNPTTTLGEGAAQRTVDIAAQAIASGWPVNECRRELELHTLRAQRAQGPGIIVHDRERDATVQAFQGALILRAGGRLDHPVFARHQAAIALGLPAWIRAGLNTDQRQRVMEAAHRYADFSAVDLCREACRLDARSVSGGRQDIIRAAFSGSALTNIFTTSVNAILLSTYDEAGDNTQGWTSSQDVNDFKTNERPRMGKGPNLAKLPKGGTADHYDRSDSVESYKIARYAKQFEVDEQDIINDSLDALGDMPREMGLAAARLRPDLVFALLLRNAALGADSVALFHSTHSNLNTSAALSAAALKTAIAAMEKMRENSVNLGLRASHLIVPSDLKHLGAELIQSTQILYGGDDEAIRGTINTINAIETLQLVAEPRLSNGVDDPVDGAAQTGSTTTWYLASSMGHNIEVGYLRGTGRAPQTRNWRLDGEGRYGMGWDVSLDIGAKALDYRGMQKNTA